MLQIFLRSHIHVDGRCFHHSTHATAGFDNILAVIADAVQRKATGSRFLQSADQADQGCLTSAVLSHKAIDGTFGNIHSKTIQCLKVFILFCQAVCLQNIVHIVLPPLLT